MIRDAKMSDIKAIYDLLKYYSEKDLLLGRSLSSLYDQLRDFKVYAVQGPKPGYFEQVGEVLVGAGALHVCWENLAEIRSLAILDSFQGKGIGKKIVEACLAEADSLGITRVFTLTYQPGFFQKLGFRYIDKGELPHKVWSDCIHCPKFPDCNEEALIWEKQG
jgi:amino-acid N-acetyltransferase